MMTDHPILLVEDSPEDYETTVRGLRKAGFTNQVYRCEDGEDALDFLYQRGAYAAPGRAKRPGVILLDLNLPGTDGRDVLAEIKRDPKLRTIPVVVLTTSRHERDIQTCYDAGANSYIQKPVRLEEFMRAIESLKAYWFEVVILPNDHA
jgi:CheY-like chemotaxis protein